MDDQLQTLLSQCGMECLFQDEQYLQAGFYAGLSIGLLVVLFGFLLILETRRRYRASVVQVHGDHGDLSITAAAVHEFVGHAMAEFESVTLQGTWIRRRGNGYVLKISGQIPFSVEAPKLTEQVRRRIIHLMREKMGLDKPIRVNITLRGYTAGDKAEPAAPTASDSQRNPLTGFPPQLGNFHGGDDSDF